MKKEVKVVKLQPIKNNNINKPVNDKWIKDLYPKGTKYTGD